MNEARLALRKIAEKKENIGERSLRYARNTGATLGALSLIPAGCSQYLKNMAESGYIPTSIELQSPEDYGKLRNRNLRNAAILGGLATAAHLRYKAARSKRNADDD